MAESNLGKHLFEAGKWILTGQYVVDIADELTRLGVVNLANEVARANGHPQLFFSHSELQALQGYPQGDGSWVCIENQSIVVAPARAMEFMEITHEFATIMCTMLDKIKCANVKTEVNCSYKEWRYSDEGLYLYFDRTELNAFKGEVLSSGAWRDINPIRGSAIISAEKAMDFMNKTHFASTVMCSMLDRLKEAGMISDQADDSSNLNNNVSSDIKPVPSSQESFAFEPSCAFTPSGISQTTDNYEFLLSCLQDQSLGIQSFFGEFSLTENKIYMRGISDPWSNTPRDIALSDEVLNLQPFDEDLYCRIIKDNFRYKLAELAAHQEQIASQYMVYGGIAGTLLGIITFNPILPFVGMSMGRGFAPRGNTLQEILPDPYLMFRQDKRSYLSIIAGGTPSARLRRIIFHPQESWSGTYFRALPAFVTQESVIPLQLFSFNDTHFYRPIAAGITAVQANYNAAKLWRKYFHLRTDGSSVDTGFKLNVSGDEIDDHAYKLFKFQSASRDLSYYYIDYQTEPSHVF
jgi:hypothetical protein